MIEITKQLEYIRNQLAWIKSKVELDNQLGLYNINKLGEDIFMHILNDVYDLNLKRAELIEKDFPAIDLIDDINKIVIQVTSTTTPKKLRITIEKFEKLTQYSDYQLQMFYIKDKPNFNKKTRKEFEKNGVTSDDILGIDDIINIIQAEPKKCQILYKTIQQRMDAISFKFNIESYFEQLEPHLQSITSDKFKQYEEPFIQFIHSTKKVLDIYAVGGSGKSHLLRYLALIETDYISLIFTKQINIEEDLKKLDDTKKYLFIVDDIDRFLDQPILLNLLSYVLTRENVKLILSYRTPSKSTIQAIYRRFTSVNNQELEIVWSEDEIKALITTLIPSLEDQKVLKLAHTFNKNPYLITQAIGGNIESIKDFSKKIIDDTKVALKDFDLSDKDISDLLFNLSLLTPISKNSINKEYQEIINKLVDSKILRELASKYRFNPDMIGDLYLANYIDENKSTFEQIVENNLKEFSDTVFTNLSYALVYNESDSLQNFIKNIINRWIANEEYNSDYLYLIDKIIYYAPMESFVYLKKATNHLEPKEINALYDVKMQLKREDISLSIIEPIISKLIFALKNDIDCEELKIEHIIKYLISNVVFQLPNTGYSNQTIESILEGLVSPLDTINFDVIFDSLSIMEEWLNEGQINIKKVDLLSNIIKKSFNPNLRETVYTGFAIETTKSILNIKNQEIIKILDKSKSILFLMLDMDNVPYIFSSGLDIVENIGGYHFNELEEDTQEIYKNIRKEALEKISLTLRTLEDENIELLSKIEKLLINILIFSTEKKEALSLLQYINRTDEYLLYQIVKGVDFLIVDYDEFEKQLPKDEEQIKDWMFKKIWKHKIDNSEILNKIILNLSTTMRNTEKIINLINGFDTTNSNIEDELMRFFNTWYKYNKKYFNEICIDELEKISNDITKNILKKFGLQKEIIPLDTNSINDNSSEDDLKIYIEVVLHNFDIKDIYILNKMIDTISNKTPNEISMYITIISQRLYFTIRREPELYKNLEHIIIQFLDWQLKYNFDVESYITDHILHDTISHNDISDEVKHKLEIIVKNDNFTIREFELNPIYKILDYGLKECIEILYNKLTSLKENGNPKHIFTHYFDSDKISEVELLSKFIKNYDDFKFLVNKVLEYYEKPIRFIGVDGNEYEAFINLDYFFKYTVKKEYLEELFNELYNDGRIDTIKLLYKIVPVRSDYLEIIVNNLNMLEDEIEDKKLIDYLNQIGKMKSWSRSHGENSSLLLNEEALFSEIMKRIDSLSLQLKLKEQLKYIELQKREELEDDISHLLDK